MKNFYQYLKVDNAELFTTVCFPNETERFPAVIFRSPYVDYAEELTENEIVARLADAHKSFIANDYANILQIESTFHCDVYF